MIEIYWSNWCRQRSLWDQEWNSIVFSDESRFCLGMHDGRARVRRRHGERRNSQFFVERHVQHTVGVMVWGAIAYGSRSPLIFIRVLEPHLLPYLDTLADPTFQQDKARPYVARVTIDFFQHNDVTLLPWPPRSPDLSPIYPQLSMYCSICNELVVAWNEIPQEDIDHLIRSMPRRVGECVAHQGASTHYQRQYLTEENVELLDHPPYSPDLSPNDFFTFPKIKNRMRGQRFQSPEEAVDAFKNTVLDLPANDWSKCFENWFERMQIFINLRGEYFENNNVI
ncbi:unnamed protein product [Acanthoscelides obtectus]|uniref:Transposase n=1 Tax=Acanthoscelides obtectus TaxID=200917 RepID=A0A9P0P0Z1_ACAOB|nr:unnamed protein product [Acanthoscelides obtectus]CAK1652318.1 Transposable element Tc3 transposase [Acanthoscelides obtectus]